MVSDECCQRNAVEMRVIIKEAYPVMRIGLKRLMEEFWPCQVIGCKDIDQAIDAVSGQSADLLIFGMHNDEVEDMKRLIAKARTCWQHHDIRVLVMSEMCESVYAPLCVLAGAKGFMPLNEREEVVLSAIKSVLLGGIFVSRPLARHPVMQQVVDYGELKILDLFSRREREIAEYLLNNTSLQDIGDKLNLSYTTVATYRNRILKKANIRRISHLSKLLGHGY